MEFEIDTEPWSGGFRYFVTDHEGFVIVTSEEIFATEQEAQTASKDWLEIKAKQMITDLLGI
jgi:hypothetical protein